MLACRGYFAAELGRWEVHEKSVAEAEARARRDRGVDDARAERLDAAAAELRAHAAWRQGELSTAVQLFQRAAEVS